MNIREDRAVSVDNWVSENRDDSKMISLTNFMNYIVNDKGIMFPLHLVRVVLIERVIGNTIFKNINNRVLFYQDKHNNKIMYLPKENCASYLFRRAFTNRPNPYYYDYYPLSAFSRISRISKLRYRYGYSKRLIVSKSSGTTSYRTHCSSKQSNSIQKYSSIFFEDGSYQQTGKGEKIYSFDKFMKSLSPKIVPA